MNIARQGLGKASGFVFKQFGGRFVEDGPEGMEDNLSEAALQLYREVFADIDCSQIIDYHVHLLGQETDRTGCYVHPTLLGGGNAVERLKANCFLSASKVTRDDADDKYVDRLLQLNRHGCPKGEVEKHGGHWRMCGLALDWAHTVDGEESPDLTSLRVPNDYSFDMAEKYPDNFIPTCSIHPFRADAIEELKRCHSKGVRMVKWLPNSQNFNPGDERCGQFYDVVRELDMVILCHTGDEHALTAGSIEDSYGNPLNLRLALDRGAKVIMAHCATEGVFDDLDHPESCRKVLGVDLLLRMMRQSEYNGLLFGDISAIIGSLRAKHISTLLMATDIHEKLVYGSDYPVPAINIVSSTKHLWWLGLISWADGKALNEIYRYNPLAYDFAVKRCLSFNEQKFPTCVFVEHPLLRVSNWRQNQRQQEAGATAAAGLDQGLKTPSAAAEETAAAAASVKADAQL